MELMSGALQVFYGFGAAGLLWSTWWESVVNSMAEEDPEAHKLLTESAASRALSSAQPEQAMPWRAFLRNGPMRALAYTHFCNNWCAALTSKTSFISCGWIRCKIWVSCVRAASVLLIDAEKDKIIYCAFELAGVTRCIFADFDCQ